MLLHPPPITADSGGAAAAKRRLIDMAAPSDTVRRPCVSRGIERPSDTSRPCDICGDIGFSEYIVLCYGCKVSSEHIYCMQGLVDTTENWYCEACLQKFEESQIEENDDTDIGKDAVWLCKGPGYSIKSKALFENFGSHGLHQSGSRKKIDSPDCTLLISDANNGKNSHIGSYHRKYVSQSGSLKPPKRGKVKFLPSEEAALLTSGTQSREYTFSRAARTPARRGRNPCASISILKGACSPDRTPVGQFPTIRAHLCPLRQNLNVEGSCIVNNVKEQDAKCSVSIGQDSAACFIEKNTKRPSTAICSSAGSAPLASKCFDASDERYVKTKIIEPQSQETLSIPQMDDSFNAELVQSNPTNKVQQMALDKPPAACFSSPSSGVALFSKSQKTVNYAQDIVDLSASIVVRNPYWKASDIPKTEVCWRGHFHVLDVMLHIYDGIQAHLPGKMSLEVYEISKNLPPALKFKMLPCAQAWPHVFNLQFPDANDIGIFFLPSQLDRSNEGKYFRLIEHLDLHGSVLVSRFRNVQLLIFTSRRLPAKSQNIAGQSYMWGIFQPVELCKKKQASKEPDIHMDDLPEEVEMEMDMVGGTEIGVTDNPIPRPDLPPGFDRVQVKFSLKKSSKIRPLSVFSRSNPVERSCDVIREGSHVPGKGQGESPIFSIRKGVAATPTGQCGDLETQVLDGAKASHAGPSRSGYTNSPLKHMTKGGPPELDTTVHPASLPSLLGNYKAHISSYEAVKAAADVRHRQVGFHSSGGGQLALHTSSSGGGQFRTPQRGEESRQWRSWKTDTVQRNNTRRPSPTRPSHTDSWDSRKKTSFAVWDPWDSQKKTSSAVCDTWDS